MICLRRTLLPVPLKPMMTVIIAPTTVNWSAKKIIATLARRAYRRPVTDADVQAAMGLFEKGRKDGDFEAGVMRALQGLLVHPEFLFRIQNDPANLAAGTRIITYECVNHPSQKWSNPTPATNINGKVIYLVSSLGGKCLDVEGESKSDNTRLIGYDCKAGLNTQFVFMGNGQLRDYAGRNKCLDLKLDLFGKLTDQVVILPCADAANSTTQLINKVTQRWYLKADGTIRNGNGWCMELAGVWIGSQWVKIATCTASGPQMWKPGILYSANAYFGTIPKLSILSAGAIGNINTTNGKSLVASGVCTTAVCGNIVAAGGGNIVATDGATVVAAGGGNIVAAGGGNIIAAGGGNIIAAGGGNVVAGGAGN